jgi:hypothetical protein
MLRLVVSTLVVLLVHPRVNHGGAAVSGLQRVRLDGRGASRSQPASVRRRLDDWLVDEGAPRGHELKRAPESADGPGAPGAGFHERTTVGSFTESGPLLSPSRAAIGRDGRRWRSHGNGRVVAPAVAAGPTRVSEVAMTPPSSDGLAFTVTLRPTPEQYPYVQCPVLESNLNCRSR